MTQLPKQQHVKLAEMPYPTCLASHLLLKKLMIFPTCCVMLASITQMPPAPEGISNTRTCIVETAEPFLGLCLNWA